jgi:hypothetical protein
MDANHGTSLLMASSPDARSDRTGDIDALHGRKPAMKRSSRMSAALRQNS